jgi:ribosomal-protein-alanine N-acetyltransferase
MIERAGPFHPEALAAIHEAAFPAPEAWSAPVIAGHMSMPGVFGFLDAEGGMLLGRVAADEAEILTLAVAPLARRRGLGRALLARAACHAHGHGATQMFLEVAANNGAALALYMSCGFREAATRRRYYADGADAKLLRAVLPFVSRAVSLRLDPIPGV